MRRRSGPGWRGCGGVTGALAGVRVLDLSYFIPGPFATKTLADYGADVIKVEPPGGEPGRRLRPFKGDDPDGEKSGLFFALNLNKRGVVLEPRSPEGRDGLLALASRADVVVESFAPGVMASLGLGYEDLRRVNSKITLASISSFGQTGPWRDYTVSDTVLYAMGGAMYMQGAEDRAPLKLGGSVALLQAGVMSAAAIMAAILWQSRTGEGQWLDLSLYELQSASNAFRIQQYMVYQFSGHIHRRRAGQSEVASGSGVYPCADGYIEVYVPPQKWGRLLAVLGNPAEISEERWREPLARMSLEFLDIFTAAWLPWLLERTRREAWDALQAEGILSGPLNTVADLAADPVFRERGFWAEVEHAALGKVTLPGRPFLMSATPWELRRAAPLLGEHTGEVLAEAGLGPDAIATLAGAGR